MKYFTMQWWSGGVEDHMAAFRAYEAYVAGVKPRLPSGLRRLTEDVSLHDSRLRRLCFAPEKKMLTIDLDGCGPDEGQPAWQALKIQLAYGQVAGLESLSDPEVGLAGPHGYGDLGYDEVEVLASGLFQHRMLFSTGIELAVTFGSFELACEKTPQEPRRP